MFFKGVTKFFRFDISQIFTLIPIFTEHSNLIVQIQGALSSLQTRTSQIAKENAKLYDKMRERIMKEPNFSSSDEEDGSTSSEAKTSSCSNEYGNRAKRKERLMKTKYELKAEVKNYLVHSLESNI